MYRSQQFCEDKSDCDGIQMHCHGKNSEWMNKNCQRTCESVQLIVNGQNGNMVLALEHVEGEGK